MSASKTELAKDNPNEAEVNTAPKWSPWYMDPTNDIVLKSSDGMLFRASSHVLKRESTLFESMLSNIPNPPHMTAADAIPLNFPSSSISIFLDFASLHDDYLYIFRIPLLILHRTLRFIQHLDSTRLVPLFQSTYQSSCNSDPLEWLLCASEDNNLESAKAALTQHVRRSGSFSTTTGLDLAWRVRPDWRHALLRCFREPDVAEAPAPGSPAFYAHYITSARVVEPSPELAQRATQFVLDVERDRREAVSAC